MNFEIITCKEPKSIPLVVHIPHSSTIIPPEIRMTFCLDDDQLRHELLRMTDWYTDRLFNGVVELGGVLFINRMSRLVVDPERFPDDDQEIMTQNGMGAIYKGTQHLFPSLCQRLCRRRRSNSQSPRPVRYSRRPFLPVPPTSV